jgi:hypothetical protein
MSIFSDEVFLKELIKIVADKFIIALILLVAGLYISRLLERYKSTQGMIQEQQKILFPETLRLVQSAQDFTSKYDENLLGLSSLTSEVGELIYSIFASNLLSIKIENGQLPESLIKKNVYIIDAPIFSGKSIRSLAVAQATNDEIKELFLKCRERPRTQHWKLRAIWAGLKSRFGTNKGVAIREKTIIEILDNDDSRDKLVSALEALIFVSKNLEDKNAIDRKGFDALWPGLMRHFSILYIFGNLGGEYIENVISEYDQLIIQIEEIPLMHISSRDFHKVVLSSKLGSKLSSIPDIRLLRDYSLVMRMNLELFPIFKLSGGDTEDIESLGQKSQVVIRRTIRKMLLPGRTF